MHDEHGRVTDRSPHHHRIHRACTLDSRPDRNESFGPDAQVPGPSQARHVLQDREQEAGLPVRLQRDEYQCSLLMPDGRVFNGFVVGRKGVTLDEQPSGVPHAARFLGDG